MESFLRNRTLALGEKWQGAFRFGMLKPLAIAKGIWVVLTFAVIVKALVSPYQHTVWPVFETASANWWAGISMYTPEGGLDSYRYSPTFAITITLYAMLPIRLSGAIWGMLGVGFAYTGLKAFRRANLPPFASEWQEALYLTASAFGVGSMTWNLQSNALVLGLFSWGAAAAARRRWWQASLLLCAPVFVKIWPGIFALMLMMKWPRQLILRVFAVGLGLATIPFLTATPMAVVKCYSDWWGTLVNSSSNRWPGYRDMAVVWESMGLVLDATVYRCTQLFSLILLVCFWRVVQNRVDPSASLAIGLSVWLAWQMIFGPGSEQSTYGMIVPLMTWWTVAAWERGWRHRWLVLPLIAVIGCSCGSIENGLGKWMHHSQCVLPLSVASFAGWLLIVSLRDRFGLPKCIGSARTCPRTK